MPRRSSLFVGCLLHLRRSFVRPSSQSGELANPLQLAADAFDGEANNCGGRDAVVSGCLATKVVSAAHEEPLGKGGYEKKIDTTLTPPGTHYGATHRNQGQRKPSRYKGFASLCKSLQRLMDHS